MFSLFRAFVHRRLESLLPSAVIFVLSLASTPTLAAPAAGTVIGNQATATYQDSTGTTRTTTSNLVQTTVSQVKSFTLTAPGAKVGAPGQTVYYPHTITNTGNGTDTYTFNAATASGTFSHTGLTYYIDADGDGNPDNFTALTTTGALPAGTQFKFVIAATVPASATTSQTGTVTISVVDTSGAPAQTNADVTTVANSVINVTKAMGSINGASPSAAPITVTLSYTNSGSQAATNLVLGDVLPSGMTYVAGSGRWSASSATALSDAVDTGVDPVGIAYDFTAGKVTATIANVAAGVSGTLTFQINIAGGLAPTTVATQSATSNVATYKTDQQASIANTNTVLFTVLQSASVVANGSAASNVNGTSEPITVAAAGQGATITFTDYVWNNGNAADSFDITLGSSNFPAGTTFTLYQTDGVTTLLDTNGNGTPDTGPVAPGSRYAVVIKATLPGGATGGPFSTTLTATSKFDPVKTDTAINTLSAITNNTVDMTGGTARGDSTPAGGANSGNAVSTGFGPSTASVVTDNPVTPNTSAATTTTFNLYVNNTSTVTDTYDLTTVTAVPGGWSVVFYADGGAGNCSTRGAALTNTGPLAAGTNRLVCAVVTVPATNTGNAAPGTTNFTFRAQSPITPTAVDTITDSVTVNATHNLALTPNGAQQTFPGGAVTYTHTVTNYGNATETITFATGFLTDTQAAAGWTSVAYIDADNNGALDTTIDTLISTSTTQALPANANKTIFVRVFAPGSATAASPADVDTLTATYNGGALTVSATDTTSVTNGLLLLKEQVTTPCGTVPAGGYASTALAASPLTSPGQCIGYRITVTNTTAGAITGIAVSDNVPVNTTRRDTCGAPTATGGATIGGTSANGTGGSITASLASLASTQSFQLSFCVQINP